jgi:hypothetical protein
MKLQEIQEVGFEALPTSQWIERNISKFPLNVVDILQVVMLKGMLKR